VLVADRKRHAVAAFHAGWRGTVKRIVESALAACVWSSFPAEDLTAAIGPAWAPAAMRWRRSALQLRVQFAYAGELFHEVYGTDPVRTKYPMLFLTQRLQGTRRLAPACMWIWLS